MSGNLFRQEAVDHASYKLTGSIMIPARVSVFAICGSIAIFFAAAIIILGNASYSRKVTVAGWLVPEAGIIRTASNQTGTISKLYVSENDEISAGAEIALISLSSVTSQGNSGASENEHLSIQLEARTKSYNQRKVQLEHKQSSLEGDKAGLRAELQQLEAQVLLHRDRIKTLKISEDQYHEFYTEELVTRAELSAKTLEVSSAELALSQLLKEKVVLVARIARTQNDIEENIIAQNISRLEAEDAISVLRQQMSTALARSELIVTSSIDGYVDALPARLGQNIRAGETIAVLSPQGGKLVAELFVPTRGAAFIEPGQNVKLKYTAFPHQRFGFGRGTILSISSSVLTPQEVASSGVPVSEPVFRVSVSLEKESISAYSRDVRLRPGMLLSADIITSKQSFSQWLFDPLYAGKKG